MFRESPPEERSSAMEVMTQSVDEVLTRSARVDHPRFFAFVPSSPTWSSVIADALVSGFNVYPNEIEDYVTGHPKIVECAAIGVHCPKAG